MVGIFEHAGQILTAEQHWIDLAAQKQRVQEVGSLETAGESILLEEVVGIETKKESNNDGE